MWQVLEDLTNNDGRGLTNSFLPLWFTILSTQRSRPILTSIHHGLRIQNMTTMAGFAVLAARPPSSPTVLRSGRLRVPGSRNWVLQSSFQPRSGRATAQKVASPSPRHVASQHPSPRRRAKSETGLDAGAKQVNHIYPFPPPRKANRLGPCATLRAPFISFRALLARKIRLVYPVPVRLYVNKKARLPRRGSLAAAWILCS